MNIIATTILLTLLGVGLVILMVWLGLSSWKAMRFKKEAITQFSDMDKRISDLDSYYNSRVDEVSNQLYTYINEYKTEVQRDIEELHTKINNEFEELNRTQLTDLWKNSEEIQQDVNKHFEKLESSIDSRFDKTRKELIDIDNTNYNYQNTKIIKLEEDFKNVNELAWSNTAKILGLQDDFKRVIIENQVNSSTEKKNKK